ncbi:MAG: globin [Nitrospirota bacterium]|nr:globin [Nitrospirota bacterium]MDH5586468.1 globin [Nitrospirota bacterium]MDH5775439.1 globin [Nitrospirota bacterium]
MEGLEAVKHSYGRAALKPEFFDRFYAIFLGSNPSFKPMFQNTDFNKQKQLLKTGVAMMISHLEGKPVGTMTLNRIGESHSKKRLNIQPALYQYWIDSLVAAAKECDSQWTLDIERSWQKALRAGVDYITEQYDKP